MEKKMGGKIMSKITEYNLKDKMKAFPSYLLFWISYALLRVFMSAEYIIKYDLVDVVVKALRAYLTCILATALLIIILPVEFIPFNMAVIVIWFSIFYLLWIFGLMRDNVRARNAIDEYECEYGKIQTILRGGNHGTE